MASEAVLTGFLNSLSMANGCKILLKSILLDTMHVCRQRKGCNLVMIVNAGFAGVHRADVRGMATEVSSIDEVWLLVRTRHTSAG
jgi:hypothetical protein